MIELFDTAYYVAFGPHGPREPIQAEAGKTIAGVAAAVAVCGIIFYALRKGGVFDFNL